MTVTKEDITEIKRSVNIVDIIRQYVQLSKNGKNYLGLCPFHGEKTPSFSVNAEKGFYHCFGCGKSGDVIRFIEEYKNVDFQSALKEIAEYAGFAIVFDDRSSDAVENPNAMLYEANNRAARIYQTILTSTEIGVKARKYLDTRGIDDELIKKFNIGLAPDEKDFLYQNLSQSFEEKVLANVGLFNFNQNEVFDTFQNRLMFPIHNLYGQTVGFSGRIWQEGDERQGKYVNTMTTAVFDKSFELYNLDTAKAAISKAHEVYLMEGFMDVIAAYKAGIMNVVATMGTALTEKHAKRLSQLAKKIILIYDGDMAGQQAIDKALKILTGLEVQVIKVPNGLDPDEFSKSNGAESLSMLMKNGRISRSEFLMDYLRPTNLSAVDTQLGFLQQLAPIIAAEMSIQAQDIYVRRLVEILPDFEYNQVEETVNSYRENVRESASNLSVLTNMPKVESKRSVVGSRFAVQQQLTNSQRIERQLLQRMIVHPELIERLSSDETIKFQYKDTASLYSKLIIEQMVMGVIDLNSFPEKLDDDERTLFYTILELNLPDEVTETELTDLMTCIKKEALEAQLTQLAAQSVEAKRMGDSNKELELTLQTVRLRQQLEGEKFGN